MEIIEKKDNQIVFSAEIDENLANAIRRYVNEIPVLAIDEVEIFKNDSPLYDETIAHRLGLVPLEMDKDFDEKTTIPLKLVAKKEGIVASGEINGKVKPIYLAIPITSLNKGQELELNAIARIGKGSQHAKFSPGLMFYRNIQEIILDKEFAEEIKQVFPDSDIKEKADKIIIIDNKKRERVDFCEGIAEKKGKNVEVKDKEGVVICLESFGQMSAEEMFKKAIGVLKKDLEDTCKKIEKGK